MQHDQQPILMQRDSSRTHQASAAEPMRDLLTDAGFTEEQLTAALGVDEQTVRAWCNGNAQPPEDVVQALQRLAEINKTLS